MKQAGKFYGIGVGPGDPELMTLKAVRTIRDCDVIVLPVSNRELTEPLLLEQNEMENRAVRYLESCTAYQGWRLCDIQHLCGKAVFHH